jgi:hypothetical protein
VTRRDRRLGLVSRIGLAGEIVSTYVFVRRLVRRRTLPETVAVLRSGVDTHVPADAESLSLSRHLAWATVRTISTLPADSRCLMRSLVLTRLMARRGLDSTFVLSAAAGPEFAAHAWVEHAGEPVLQPADDTHQSLLRL